MNVESPLRKRIELRTEIKRTARKAGGLFIGTRYHFPVGIFDPITEWQGVLRSVDIGLLFWQATVNLYTRRTL